MPSAQQPKPCYFLAPTRTCPPDGYIRLGSIISSPSTVDDPISSKLPAPPEIQSITTHSERNWSHSVTTSSNSGSVGVWASFLQVVLGAGGDVGVSWENQANQTYSAKTMKWIEFRPSLQYIRAAVTDEEIDEFIRSNKFREKIFMVTGLMVASGASGVINSMRERGLYAHVGVDGTILSGGQAPIAAGPEGSLNWGKERQTSFEDADDFVFAFRLRQVKVRKSGDISHKPRTDGALFSKEDDRKIIMESESRRQQVRIEIEGLEDEDATGLDFRMEEWDAVDGIGQQCLVAGSEE
jgi:hypothetical protein